MDLNLLLNGSRDDLYKVYRIPMIKTINNLKILKYNYYIIILTKNDEYLQIYINYFRSSKELIIHYDKYNIEIVDGEFYDKITQKLLSYDDQKIIKHLKNITFKSLGKNSPHIHMPIGIFNRNRQTLNNLNEIKYLLINNDNI